jgi:UDP-N-acetyl-D-glucosamine dehydrogenase
MSSYIIERVKNDVGGDLRGKNVILVGVAYKPNIADTRETAAMLLLDQLRSQGATVTWHDDLVRSWNGEVSGPLSGADITIVVTLHDGVKQEDIRRSAPYIFDTTGKLKGVQGL